MAVSYFALVCSLSENMCSWVHFAWSHHMENLSQTWFGGRQEYSVHIKSWPCVGCQWLLRLTSSSCIFLHRNWIQVFSSTVGLGVKVDSAAPPRQALGAFRRNEAPVRPISSELSDWWKPSSSVTWGKSRLFFCRISLGSSTGQLSWAVILDHEWY